jgi:carboxyl-terminal processing protease
MKNNRYTIVLPILLGISISIGILLGSRLNKKEPIVYNAFSHTDLGSKIDAIMYLIQERYVDTINRKQVINKAINDFLHELDPHSNYFSAEELGQMMESINGKYAGVGIRFLIHNDTLCATNIIPGSPSYQVGIKSGDQIIRVDGKPISGKKLSNEKVMDMLKGEPGSTVKVEVLRKRKKMQFTITRGVIPIQSISCSTLLNKTTGYIRLEQFSVSSGAEFHDVALQLKLQGMKKLVFDLRDNGGGVMASAIEIADEFLPQGKLIVYTQGAHQTKRSYFSSARGSLEDIELVILINSNSASASEIVAGAIQDNDRGTIMGRRSFGKGLVQEDIPLRDGSNVRLTIARYYTPTGRCIQKPYGNGIDYQDDFFERYEKGELYHVDSSAFVDSLKFVTPKGKIVYGGGGIMPGMFLPLDTMGTSHYLTNLRYSMAFGHFAYDFVNKVGRNKWKDEQDFRKQFQVNDALMNTFVSYAARSFKIPKNEKEFTISKSLIGEFLKAEIARKLWIEQGYLCVMADYDKDILHALKQLEK